MQSHWRTLVRASLLKTFIGVREPFWRIEANRSFRLFRLGNTFIGCDSLLLQQAFLQEFLTFIVYRGIQIFCSTNSGHRRRKIGEEFCRIYIEIKIARHNTRLSLYLLGLYISITIASVHLLTSFFSIVSFLLFFFFLTMTMINCNVIHKG